MGFDEDVALAKKQAERASLVLRSVHLNYLVVLAFVAIALAWTAVEAYGWHERSVARLEVKATSLVARATALERGEAVWRVEALKLAEIRRVDTLRTVRYIASVRPLTAYVRDTSSAGVVSEIPIAAVPLEKFDGLVVACSRERADCSSLLLAKDSLVDYERARRVAAEGQFETSEEQRRGERRASIFSKVLWGVAGAGLGRLACLR